MYHHKTFGQSRIDEPKVAIIIVTFNQGSKLIDYFNFIREIDYTNYEFIVVDNNSSKGTIDIIKKNIFKGSLIKNKKNLGFARSSNIGISIALKRDFDYVLLMNNDVRVDSGFLKEMVSLSKQVPQIGIIGPIVFHMDCLEEIQSYGEKLDIQRGMPTNGFYGQSVDVVPEVREVDFITGCCLLMKREVLEKVGSFDEKYFMYYEDLDLCIRVKKMGYKLIVTSKAKIWHKHSYGPKRKFPRRALTLFYCIRNEFYFVKKHASRKAWWWLLFRKLLTLPGNSVHYILPLRFDLLLAYYLGLIYGILEIMRKRVYG